MGSFLSAVRCTKCQEKGRGGGGGFLLCHFDDGLDSPTWRCSGCSREEDDSEVAPQVRGDTYGMQGRSKRCDKHPPLLPQKIGQRSIFFAQRQPKNGLEKITTKIDRISSPHFP